MLEGAAHRRVSPLSPGRQRPNIRVATNQIAIAATKSPSHIAAVIATKRPPDASRPLRAHHTSATTTAMASSWMERDRAFTTFDKHTMSRSSNETDSMSVPSTRPTSKAVAPTTRGCSHTTTTSIQGFSLRPTTSMLASQRRGAARTLHNAPSSSRSVQLVVVSAENVDAALQLPDQPVDAP